MSMSALVLGLWLVASPPPEGKTVVFDDRVPGGGVAPALTVPRALLVEPGATFAEVLGRLPGLQTQQLGGPAGLAQLRIRGSNPDQVLIYLDGIGLNQADGSPVDLSELPIWSARQVRIWRSYGPLGRGAPIGGALDIESRRPREGVVELGFQPGQYSTYGGQVFGGWAADDERRSVGLSVDFLSTAGNYPWLDDKGTLFDTSDDEEVTRQNNTSRRFSALLTARHALGKSCGLRLIDHFSWKEQGLPGPASRATTATRYRRVTNLTALGLRCQRRAKWRLDVNAGFRYLASRGEDPKGELYLKPTDGERLAWTPSLRATWGMSLSRLFRLGVHLEGAHERFRWRDLLGGSGADTHRMRGAAALEVGAFLPWIDLELAPRIRLDVLQDAGGEAVLEPTWKLGVAYRGLRVKGLNVHASVGRSVRFPNFYELYGDGALVLPSPDLVPERALTVAGGLRYTPHFLPVSWGAEFSLTGFGSWVDELIQFRRNTAQHARAENDQKAELAGVELALKADLFNHLRLTFSHTTLLSQSLSPEPSRFGRPLPLRPRGTNHGRLEIYARTSTDSEIRLTCDMDHRTAHTVDPAGLVWLPERVIASIGVGWRLNLTGLIGRSGSLNVGLTLRNIADSRVVDLIGYPLPGRTFTGLLTWRESAF